jgi:hypothetical protein
VIASGKNTSGDGGTTNSPATAQDITHGIKLIHNIDANPPTATLNLHNNNDKLTSTIGMKFNITNGDITAAQDKFCLISSSGAVGIGGMTTSELTAVAQSSLNRKLHVTGNVMIGRNPVVTPNIDPLSAMIMLNRPTATPTTTEHPGLYHREVSGSTSTTLGLQDSPGGLGITSPNFITFQTGTPTQNNSIIL